MTEEKEDPSSLNKKMAPLDDRKADFFSIMQIIKAKKHFFYLTIFLTVFGTLVGHYLKTPTYRTGATLYIKNIEQQPTAAEYLLNQHVFKMSRGERIESYVNHLKSDSFYLKIAEKVKFHPEFENMNLTSPAVQSKLGWVYWKRKILNNPQTPATEKKLLTPIESIVGFIKQTVTYQADYESQFLKINTNTLDDRTSQLLANIIAEEFVSITNRHNVDEIKEIENFVLTKKDETEAKVKDLDRKLIRFKQKNNIVSAKATTDGFAERLSGLEAQIESAKLQKDENDKLIKFFKKNQKTAMNRILDKGSKTQGYGDYETTAFLQKKLEQLKRQKSAFSAQGNDEYSWQISKINKEIDSTVVQIRKIVGSQSVLESDFNPQEAQTQIQELSNKNQVLKTKITTLKRARKDIQAQVSRMPKMQQEYIQLENQFKLEIENLANLERKEKELEIQRISHKKEVKVDQLAPLPGPTARGPLLFKLIFSALVALFLGVVIIIGLESLDPSVKRRQDLYDCGVDFFGEVPYVETDRKIAKDGKFQFGSPEDLVCHNKPESVESMSFKYMRARIESMRYKEKKDCQVISLSSALHNEGKSFVTANLAISLSQLKRRTILIDGDLRRPSQSAYFGISSQYGLVDLLNMKKDFSEVLKKDVFPNLDLLPAGFSGHDSTELISSQKFRLLLDYLRNEYEYVIIDTPPTFAVVDAAIISSFSDIPILVSTYRRTRKADLHEAYNDLLQVSYKKVFGVINKAMVSNARIHYYGYPLYSTDQMTASNVGKESTTDDEAQAFMDNLNKKSS